MAKKESAETVKAERQEILKEHLPPLLKDERLATKEYSQKAALFPENRAVFKRLSKDEKRHFRELSRMQEDISKQSSKKPPKR